MMNKAQNNNSEILLQRKDSIFSDKTGTDERLLDWYDPKQLPFTSFDMNSPTAHPVICGWFDCMRDIKEYDGINIADTKFFETE